MELWPSSVHIRWPLTWLGLRVRFRVGVYRVRVRDMAAHLVRDRARVRVRVRVRAMAAHGVRGHKVDTLRARERLAAPGKG